MYIEAGTFTPNAESNYNVEEGRRGIISSQWYHRMFSFGFSQDFPLNETKITAVSDKVYLITGSSELAYAALAVDSEEGIILIEPTLNPFRSEVVDVLLKQSFPGKQVIAVTTTHHHMDHFGGVSYFAAKGAEIIIGAEATGFVEQVLGANHDLLNIDPSGALVTGVTEQSTIKGAFEAIPLSTPHTEDMLVFYFEKIKALFVGDIFNAGLYYGYDYYPETTQEILQGRAQLLKSFIAERELDVELLITVHGGQTTIDELNQLANKN